MIPPHVRSIMPLQPQFPLELLIVLFMEPNNKSFDTSAFIHCVNSRRYSDTYVHENSAAMQIVLVARVVEYAGWTIGENGDDICVATLFELRSRRHEAPKILRVGANALLFGLSTRMDKIFVLMTRRTLCLAWDAATSNG